MADALGNGSRSPRPRVVQVLRGSPSIGGLERTVATSCLALVERGYDCTVAIVGEPADGATRSFFRRSGIGTTRCADWRDAVSATRRADLVHWHAATMTRWSAATVVARRLVSGAPGVLTVHLPASPGRLPRLRGRVRQYLTLLGRGAILRATGTIVLAPSADAAALCRRRFRRLVAVRGNLNGAQRIRATARAASPFRVAFVGRLDEHHKRPTVAVDAFIGAMNATDGAAMVMDVVGDGPDRESVEAHARARGAGDEIRFHGWLDDPGSVLGTAHVLLLTSRDEGCPTVVLEAAGAAVPSIVAEGVEGLSEALGDAVRTVPRSGRAGDYARSIVECESQRPELAELGLRAQAAFDRTLSVAAAADRLHEIYSGAIGRRCDRSPRRIGR